MINAKKKYAGDLEPISMNVLIKGIQITHFKFSVCPENEMKSTMYRMDGHNDSPDMKGMSKNKSLYLSHLFVSLSHLITRDIKYYDLDNPECALNRSTNYNKKASLS